MISALFSAAFMATLSAVCADSSTRSTSLTCSELVNVDLGSGIQVSSAVNVAVGELLVPTYSGIGTLNNSFPLCSVEGIITYDTNDTADINGDNTLTWQFYLPEVADYNGRFMIVGNSGYAGVIDTTTMMTEFNLGYAIAGTDGGHSLAATGNTSFAPFLENMGEIDAWLHNAVAMTTPPVRSLATEYYNESPAYSYYYGCSTGGGQGYALAEIYPDLFDGIYAGSPGNWYSHLILSFLYNYLQTNGSGHMSQDALNFITAKVIEECDLLDGVKDNLVENPLACHFNVQTLACSHDESATSANGTVLCLTSAQVEAAEKIYAGPKNTLTGEQIYPGFNVGGELGWIDQETILYSEYTSLILKELVFKNLEYNVDTFNFGSDVCNVDEVASPLLDAISPNLSAFESRGGKLITTQGWADPYNAPTWPIEFLEMINSATAGRNAAEFMQLYMVPGGGHCGPNTGYPAVPGTYDVLGALVPWVEQGIVPTQMLSTGSLDGLNTTRKLCPYPKNAKYISGSIDDWASYTCA